VVTSSHKHRSTNENANGNGNSPQVITCTATAAECLSEQHQQHLQWAAAFQMVQSHEHCC